MFAIANYNIPHKPNAMGVGNFRRKNMNATYTEVEAKVNFGKLGLDNYQSKVNLFNKDRIELNGNWSNESVISYCKSAAEKLKYQNAIIEIYKYDEKGNEEFLRVRI